MELKEINVLVSGASIAGLSTAYWLKKYGFRVTVVERASHIRPGGQALDVRGPALVVADRIGIRTSLGFSSDEPLTYDYRDVTEQKQLLAERVTNVGTEMPKIVEHMQQSDNFYFDSMNQIIMGRWCNGRVVLVGDAAYIGQDPVIPDFGLSVIPITLKNYL